MEFIGIMACITFDLFFISTVVTAILGYEYISLLKITVIFNLLAFSWIGYTVIQLYKNS